MLTENDREAQEVKKLNDQIRFCEEAIAKAEKYERLSENADWKAYLGDLRVVIRIHESEIEMALSILSDAPSNTYVKGDRVVSSKSDWVAHIERHHLLKWNLENWIQEPDRIMKLASQARQKLPEFKQQLAQVTGGNHAG